MRKRVWISIAVVAVLVVVGDLSVDWLRGFGTGEYCNSPDGRFRASAMNKSSGSLLRGRSEYVEIYVVDSNSGTDVWRGELRSSGWATYPDYSDRSKNHITWATDSSSVSIRISDGATIDIDTP